jgi:hypothetical protein
MAFCIYHFFNVNNVMFVEKFALPGAGANVYKDVAS